MTTIRFTELAATIGFAEGPQFAPDGLLYATAMSRGLVVGIDPDRPGAPLVEIETGGGPNGLVATEEGTFYVAQNGAVSHATRSSRPVHPGIQRIDPDRTVHDVVDAGCESPNDLVVGPDGAVWFTDPGPSHVPPTEPSVRRWSPELDELTTVATGFRYPNGIAFGPDGRRLYVADSDTDQVLAFRVAGPSLTPEHVLDLRDDTEEPVYPDGIAIDRGGRLWVAGLQAGAIIVVDPESGSRLARFDTGIGSRPTNLCFDAEERRVAVTLSKGGRVVVFENPIGASA